MAAPAVGVNIVRRLVATAALACSIGMTMPADASVTFTLQNVVFNDGTMATGSFVTSDDFLSLISASVSTSAGTATGFLPPQAISAFTYTDTTTAGSGALFVQSGGIENQQRQLRLNASGRSLYLTVPTFALGSTDLTLAPNGLGSREFLTFNSRAVVSGQFIGAVTEAGTDAVPEPAAWTMMIVGFGGIGCAMRRRLKQSASIRFA